jgi:MinD-like ATPase involved in chromosome partitioning or flagellar assembly
VWFSLVFAEGRDLAFGPFDPLQRAGHIAEDGEPLFSGVRADVRAVGRVRVVVNQVTDGREGLRVFQKLKEVAGRFSDVQLEYLGHWERDEKVPRSVMKRKILLDWDEAARSLPSLDLIAKRLGAALADAGGAPGPRRVSRESRGFWSILLAGPEGPQVLMNSALKVEGKI